MRFSEAFQRAHGTQDHWFDPHLTIDTDQDPQVLTSADAAPRDRTPMSTPSTGVVEDAVEEAVEHGRGVPRSGGGW